MGLPRLKSIKILRVLGQLINYLEPLLSRLRFSSRLHEEQSKLCLSLLQFIDEKTEIRNDIVSYSKSYSQTDGGNSGSRTHFCKQSHTVKEKWVLDSDLGVNLGSAPTRYLPLDNNNNNYIYSLYLLSTYYIPIIDNLNIHSFNKYLWNMYHVLCMILGIEQRIGWSVNKKLHNGG